MESLEKSHHDSNYLSLKKITRVAEAMAMGDFSQIYESNGPEDERVAVAINQMLNNLKNVVKQAKTIAQGDYRAQITPLSPKDELGTALFQMTNTLLKMSTKNDQDTWIKNGQAGLANLMRGDLGIHALSKLVISYLAKYLNALVGTFYCIDEHKRDLLKLTGSFAYSLRKGNKNEIKFGQGLVGQCALEKEPIIFSDIPDDYITVNSSLGTSAAKNILVVPLMFEREVFGVIELGSCNNFKEDALKLIEHVNESIAIAIKSAQDSEKIKSLLEESKKQARELQAQQEELKAINEELERQQNSLQRSNAELEYQTKRLRESEENIRVKNEALEKSTKSLAQQKTDVENARNELENKAKELELASQYKSDFLANMSHELRTPLNSLLILSEDLAKNEEKNLNEEQVKSAQIIHSGGKDLLNLINDILDLSKVEAGKLQIEIEDVEIKDLLDNLQKQFEPIAKKKALSFIIHSSDNTTTKVKTDKKRLEQILKNFLSNAVKFTASGSVTIRVHKASDTVKINNTIGFSIEDTGIGIPADKQNLIFEAFQQVDGSTSRKYGGTGLGLSISKELAKLLGCEIKLKSEPGKGSCFTIYVPLSEPSIQSSPTKPVECVDILFKDDREYITATDKTLLIIEDDNTFAKVLMEHAQKRGYKCVVSLTGQEGILCAQKYRPKAITLDMLLPDISGERVLEQLKFNLETRHIPVHIISSSDRSFFALQRGAVGHLRKPPSIDELNNIFSRFDRAISSEPKKVLIVEDDPHSQRAIGKCIANDNLDISACTSGKKAFELLVQNKYDCVILDLNLPDMNGFEILENIAKNKSVELPPIIIYTGKDLAKHEQEELYRYASSIVVKGVKSCERLIDELHLFLHSVDSELPREQLDIVRKFHEPGQLIKDKKVLLVDDDMRNTYALSAALKKKGLVVIMADNGELALQRLNDDPTIDIVVMDIMMPVMDGYEAMTKIRAQERFINLPIIALTAKVMPEDKAKAFSCGASDFLTKPVDIQQLTSLIQILLFKTTEVCPPMELHA